ncbi:MAG: hypothetical protein OHK0023_16470 [Anaerolineae bacterium]
MLRHPLNGVGRLRWNSGRVALPLPLPRLVRDGIARVFIITRGRIRLHGRPFITFIGGQNRSLQTIVARPALGGAARQASGGQSPSRRLINAGAFGSTHFGRTFT